jgi:hypothetical protein
MRSPLRELSAYRFHDIGKILEIDVRRHLIRERLMATIRLIFTFIGMAILFAVITVAIRGNSDRLGEVS